MNDKLNFEIRPSKDDQFYFVQLAANGQVLSTSETYKRKQGAVSAAWSAGATEVYEIVNDEKKYFEMDDQDAKPPQQEQEPENATTPHDPTGGEGALEEGNEAAPESPSPGSQPDQGPATGESTGKEASGNA